MNDAAADYQMAYDAACQEHGPHSPQAQEAELAARNFFQGQDHENV